jgi:hypothetical protein
MKRFTKLLLALTLCVLGVGSANALKLNATFNTPAANGSWNSGNNTYSWTGSTNNLMTIFTFPNGELVNYTSIHLTTSDYTNPYRICFMNGSTAVKTISFYSVGQKDINFADREETQSLDMSKITHISFGGWNSGSGSVGLTNVYLEGPDPLYREVKALGNPITFDEALASTDPFVVVQNGMVLCGPLSATDGSLTFKDVSEIDDYAWTIKFEEDTEHSGSYFMQLFNSSNVSKGYINASVWSHTYLSNINKSGSKGEQQDGALWTVTALGNGKYSIRNLGVAEGNYNDKPNGNEGDRVAAGQGYLGITPNGYWANHVTHYNTSGEWQFYTLDVQQLPINDPYYFGWDDLVFDGDAAVSKDDDTRFVRDARGYAPYWTETAKWQFSTPFDASGYKYLIFYTKRNCTRYGNEDNDTGGSVFVNDDNGSSMRGDDYNNGNYVTHTGTMWMNIWNEQRIAIVDLQWLANTDKFGDGSECKSLDITKLKAFGFSGDFTIGGAFFTNTLPNTSGDYKRTFTNEETPVYDNFGTICLPYSAVCCGAQLYEITGMTSGSIAISEFEGVMEAGKPYFYKTLEAKQQYWGSVRPETAVYFFKAGYKQETAPVENNGLIGTYTATTAPAGTNFLILSANKLWNTEGCTGDDAVNIGANKAYIDKTKIVNKSASARLFLPFGDVEEEEVTGIQTVKVAKNNGIIFNLNGQRMNKLTKGLNIIAGKKVLMK